MSIEHKTLAQGNWGNLSLIEQMANIGSEVVRALNWKEKNNPDYYNKARLRALELLDFTINDPKNRFRLTEITRLREVFVDYFWFDNIFKSTSESWKKYFFHFVYAARKNC